LYRLKEGLTLEHNGKSFDGFCTALYDTCSEISLLSQRYADAQGLPYSTSNTQIATSLGSTGAVVGEIDGPLHCVLNRGTSVECRTLTAAATRFLVVRGVEHMYDVLISSHCARDWGARPDPFTKSLDYRPFLTKGDKNSFASIPLLATSDKTWVRSMATGLLMCGVLAAHALESKPCIEFEAAAPAAVSCNELAERRDSFAHLNSAVFNPLFQPSAAESYQASSCVID